MPNQLEEHLALVKQHADPLVAGLRVGRVLVGVARSFSRRLLAEAGLDGLEQVRLEGLLDKAVAPAHEVALQHRAVPRGLRQGGFLPNGLRFLIRLAHGSSASAVGIGSFGRAP